MFNFLRIVSADEGLGPHSVHFIPDNVDLMWLLVLSNALIVLAYILIPIALVYIVRRRRDLVFNWIFLLFGLFIALCGVTHAMHIVIFWYPLYWLQGIIEMLTVLASFGTFFALLLVLPKIVKLTSPQQLENANKELSDEAEARRKIDEELTQKNKDLESINNEILASNKELLQANELMAGRESALASLEKEFNDINKKHA